MPIVIVGRGGKPPAIGGVYVGKLKAVRHAPDKSMLAFEFSIVEGPSSGYNVAAFTNDMAEPGSRLERLLFKLMNAPLPEGEEFDLESLIEAAIYSFAATLTANRGLQVDIASVRFIEAIEDVPTAI